MLKRKFGNSKPASLAYPQKLNFKDGVIELDVVSPAGRSGYVGMAFHIKDNNHYETLYFRPGSSGTINAVQYIPKKKLNSIGGIMNRTNTRLKQPYPKTNGFM